MSTVLVSWSGKQSQAVAQAFYEWITTVVPGLEPWISTRDISPGGRWFTELMDQLEKTNICVICLAPDNIRSPWLYFEAGAIAAKSQDAKVCCFASGVSPSEIPGPFQQFQITQADIDGTWALVKEINKALGGGAHNEELLRTTFETRWPRLRESLKDAMLEHDAPSAGIATDSTALNHSLSTEAAELLNAAVQDQDGHILVIRTLGGLAVQANGHNFAANASPRDEATWQSAVRDLLQFGLIEPRGHKGEVFAVTSEGYRAADASSTDAKNV